MPQKPAQPNLWLIAVSVRPIELANEFRARRPAPAMSRLQGRTGGK